MTEERGTVGSSAAFSEQEVERARRLALSRLDELEASFHRVTERLVSVEARLGELAEDLRVRVTALQQQTRDAVTASLQMLAPQRETTDIGAGLEEIRAVVRADVQEIAASIQASFVEAERRLLEEQADFLERAGATGEDVASRTEGLAQAVESLRQQIASPAGLDELRGAIDGVRQEVAGSVAGADLRDALEALRRDVSSQMEQVRGAVAEPASGGAAGALEETASSLAAAAASLREQAQELVGRVEAIDQRSASTEERSASLEERLAADAAEASSRFAAAQEGLLSAMEQRLAQLQERLEGAVRGLAEQVPEAAPGMDLTALDERLAAFRERVESSVRELNLQTVEQAEQARAEIEGWMTRYGELLEGSLSAAARREVGPSAPSDDVRAEVMALAAQVQDHMNRLEASFQDLRDRITFTGMAPVPGAPAVPVTEPAVPVGQGEPAMAEPQAPPVAEPPAMEMEPAAPAERLPEPSATEVAPDALDRAEPQVDEAVQEPATEALEEEDAEEDEGPPPPPEPAEGDAGSKKLPDIWSWGPRPS